MPQKMNDVVKPESFLSGADAGRSTFDESLAGLSWVSAGPEDILAGLGGIGRLAAPGAGIPVAMDAIIANATEMNAKVATVNKERKKEAAKDPIFAVKLKVAIDKTSAPGTNEARGVMQAMDIAAQKAQQAKKEEREAKVLLAQGDRRGAAAKAVSSLSTAREAMTLATKAEKTRLTRSLDKVAKTLEAQANYVEGIIRTETSRGGDTLRANALMSSVQALRAQASKLRAQSAAVATVADVPDNAPTQKRVAELANRFNVRTSRDATDNGVSQATISVLSDIADSALAQARDYDGAVAFYGNDALGRLMADIEFGSSRAVSSLSRAVGGMGYVQTLPALAMAEKVLDEGVRAANAAYVEAVIPAFTGAKGGTAQLQSGVAKLMGLGGLGLHPRLFLETDERWFGVEPPAKNRGDKWDRWCASTYAGNAAEIQKCQNPKVLCDAIEPWSAAGKLCRGNTDIGGAAAQVFTSIPKIAQDAAKTASDINKMTAIIAPSNPAPPTEVKPPIRLPIGRELTSVGAGVGSRFIQQLDRQQQQVAQQPPSYYGGEGMGTMTKVAIGGAALLVGGAAFLWWTGRRAMPPASSAR